MLRWGLTDAAAIASLKRKVLGSVCSRRWHAHLDMTFKVELLRSQSLLQERASSSAPCVSLGLQKDTEQSSDTAICCLASVISGAEDFQQHGSA